MKTSYLTRFGDAMERLCSGYRPSDDLLRIWFDAEQDDDSLQEFAIQHGPEWAQGIALIEAAQHLAGHPEEGVGHCLPVAWGASDNPRLICSCGDPDPYHKTA